MSLHEQRLHVLLTLLLHSLYVVVYMSYRLKCQFDFVFYKRQETLYVYLETEELSLDQDCRCYVTAIQFLCYGVCESHVCLVQCHVTSVCLRGNYVTVAILSFLELRGVFFFK